MVIDIELSRLVAQFIPGVSLPTYINNAREAEHYIQSSLVGIIYVMKERESFFVIENDRGVEHHRWVFSVGRSNPFTKPIASKFALQDSLDENGNLSPVAPPIQWITYWAFKETIIIPSNDPLNEATKEIMAGVLIGMAMASKNHLPDEKP